MLFVLYLALPILACASVFDIKYEWNYFEYDYPNEAERVAATANGSYIPLSSYPNDVDVFHGFKKSKIFLTFPSFPKGNPASLATISDKKRNGKNLVSPYPDWSWYQNVGSCPQKRIVSASRVQVDECGRVWILDNGRHLGAFTCPPQLLAFDANTNKLLVQYEIPSNFYKHTNPIFVTPIVDVRDKCENAFVYIAECNGYNLIVYDVAKKTSWKLRDKTFFPMPEFGTFTIEGQSFELMDGILGLSLSPYTPGQDRILFYNSLSSNTQNWVYTSSIRNQSAFENNDPFALASPQIFNTYAGRRSSQTGPTAISHDGIMYFGTAADTSIYCWDTKTEYGSDNINLVEYNRETLQFNSGIKIIYNKKGDEELWIMTHRLQKIYTGTISLNEINFRLQVAKLNELSQCQSCEKTI